MKLRRNAVAGSVIGLASLAASAAAQGVAPSQIVPGDAATVLQAKPPLRFPVQQGLKPPAGSDAIRLTVRDLRIESDLPESITVRSELALPIGREISAADVYRFASALQDRVLDRGYPLARVVVPPQDMDAAQAVVRIRIISGFVESIDVSALPASVRGIVRRVLAPVAGQRALRAHELERRLVIAGNTAGLDLRSALTPGQGIGATVLLLSGRHRSVQGALSVDNRQGAELGGIQTTLSIAANSALRLGEQLVVSFAAPASDLTWSKGIRRYASLSARTPIGSNGLEAGSTIVFSASKPRTAGQASLEIESEYRMETLFLSYPLLLTRNARMSVQISLEAAFEQTATSLLGPRIALSEDRTRVVRAQLSGSHTLPHDRRVDYSIEFANGFGGFGARTASDASVLLPLSRLGADAKFQRLSGDLKLASPVAGRMSAHLLLRGATGFGAPLLRSEQEALATPDLISGLQGGSAAGDDMYGARFELRGDWGRGRSRFMPYVFGAWATAHLEQPLANETANIRARSAGAGVRLAVSPRASLPMAVTAEWSHVGRAGIEPARSRVRLSLGAQF